MPEKQVSALARKAWKRFNEYYGARFSEQQGFSPSESWCELIDDSDRVDVEAALVNCRTAYLQFPPTLPQFEALIAAASKTRTNGERNHVRDYWRSAVISEVVHRYGYRTLAQFEPVLIANRQLGDPLRRLIDELENAEKSANARTAAMWITCQRRCAEIVRAYPGLSRSA